MSLFDNDLEKYAIFWNGEMYSVDLDAQIKTEDGKNIGRIISSGLIRKKALLLDENGKIILQTLKHHTPGASYNITDSQGKCFAKTKSNLFPWKEVFTLKDENDDILVVKKHSGKKNIFDVHSKDNSIVAQFALRGKYEKNERGKKEHHNVCYIHIRDFNVNRKNLFGLLISFISKDYDFVPMGRSGG